MIPKEEIESKSKEFEIHISNVQRDYIFGWFIYGVFTVGRFKDEIFLKGGNALRKGYFSNTRYSSDLDFGIPMDIEEGVLLEEINKVCDLIQEKTGVRFVKEQNTIKEKFVATDTPLPDLKVYEAKVCFQDFYSHAAHIKIKISMDVTRFDKVVLPIQVVPLIHPYSDSSEIACEIRCMKLEEIIATKLKCLLQRQHVPDLYDYSYSIQLLGGSLDKEEIVKVLVQKTIFSRNPHVLKRILCATPFGYFRKYWNVIICAKQAILNIEDAIKTFIADLEVLFSIYQDNGDGQLIFFGPEMRAPIMKAGHEQTLLKLRYRGADRLVEPYSLKYLERKSGQSREYFYAFNCSGGNSSPGVRGFIAEGVEAIENTDQKFIPRFPIELCKAGELPEKKYLFDPNKPSRVRSARKVVSGIMGRTYRRNSGTKYIYQCNSCGKKFTKKIQSGTLGQHKDKGGYRCSSRYGYYLDTKY